jgi:hypothetical protein
MIRQCAGEIVVYASRAELGGSSEENHAKVEKKNRVIPAG